MADILGKAVEQAVHRCVGALLAADVQHDTAVVHHQRAVAKGECIVHVVGDHQTGQVVFGHDLLCQLQHLIRCGGVEGGGMLVQQQQLGGDEGRHQQGQRLTLPAREQPHRLLHPILQPKAKLGEPFGKERAVLAGDAREGRGMPGRPQKGQRKVFLDRHMGSCAAQRVLKHPPDSLGALEIRQEGDILTVQRDRAGIGDELTGDGVEKRGFARAVGANDRGEIPLRQMKIHPLQRHLLIDGAGIEGLTDIFQLKHGGRPPFRHGRGGGGRLPWRAAPVPRWPAPR